MKYDFIAKISDAEEIGIIQAQLATLPNAELQRRIESDESTIAHLVSLPHEGRPEHLIALNAEVFKFKLLNFLMQGELEQRKTNNVK